MKKRVSKNKVTGNRRLVVASACLAILAAALVLATLLYATKYPGPLPVGVARDTALSRGDASFQPGGQYVDYTATAVAEAEGQSVLFFYAPWCWLCRAMDEDIRARGVPSGFTIIKVDYDTNQPLRQKYGVTFPNTFVKVDPTGSFISRYVAHDPSVEALWRDFL